MRLLGSWPFDPWLVATLVLVAAIYVRGWLDPSPSRSAPLVARSTLGLPGWAGGRLPGAWLADRAVRGVAASGSHDPALAADDGRASLALAGCAAVPPDPRPAAARSAPAGPCPCFGHDHCAGSSHRLTHPGAALPLFLASTWLWHVPWLYESALRWSTLHYLQHACFLASGLVFWYPVVRPYPARPRWSTWLLVPYLILADVSNTVLSALLTFSNRPIYTYYTEVPRLGGLSPLDDQAAAGVIMWVPGSVAFLLPLFAIGLRILFGEPRVRKPAHGFGRSPRSHRPEQSPSDPRPARPGAAPDPGAVSEVAACPAGASTAARGGGGGTRRRWVPRAPGRRVEPGRSRALGPLAGPRAHRAARGRQSLVHGVSRFCCRERSPAAGSRRSAAGRAHCGANGWR